ncbi:MAG: DNA double-strand break repair nuclease NurA [Leptolyngbya sp. SIO4C1]|nr:DNA double-strand break repair nuclease NurA [Leptolyngbya sp. SIO4C1]
MPIKPSQVQAILHQKRADFTRFNQSSLSRLQVYQRAWQALAQQPSDSLQQWFQRRPMNVGGRLIEAWPATENGIRQAQLQWRNREHSLDWVRSQLTGITTFAVDGSQIFPSKDISIPVALVQVGWFENPHSETGRYFKDIDLDVMTPADFQDEGISRERLVQARRFCMETQRLIRYMQQVKQPERCLAFFDGALVASFADTYEAAIREVYLKALLQLLDASEQYRVPLVGYIDTSEARDLATLLEQFHSLETQSDIHDAAILRSLMQWGDRTPLFRCDRGGILSDYKAHAERLSFVYLKTNRGYPARLEMPLWMHEAGLSERVINWVRAEVAVGGGYPYAIETADQTAVLQNLDRQVFFRILQDWAEQENLKLRLSRKMVSKARRR